MVNDHDRRLAKIEIQRCFASLRQIVAAADDIHLLDQVYGGLNKVIGETVDKRYDVRRVNRTEKSLQRQAA